MSESPKKNRSRTRVAPVDGGPSEGTVDRRLPSVGFDPVFDTRAAPASIRAVESSRPLVVTMGSINGTDAGGTTGRSVESSSAVPGSTPTRATVNSFFKSTESAVSADNGGGNSHNSLRMPLLATDDSGAVPSYGSGKDSTRTAVILKREDPLASRMKYYNRLAPSQFTAPAHVVWEFLPYNLYDGHKSQGSLATIFSIWSVMVGSGLLVMPWGFAASGAIGATLVSSYAAAIQACHTCAHTREQRL